MTVTEGQLLWEPSSDFVENAGITKYIAWLKNKNIIHCENYEALWQWSIDETEDFLGFYLGLF
jgi:acetoacetyl-CoA synthetase